MNAGRQAELSPSQFEKRLTDYVRRECGLVLSHCWDRNGHHWSLSYNGKRVEYSVLPPSAPAPERLWLLRIEEDEPSTFASMLAPCFRAGSMTHRSMPRLEPYTGREFRKSRVQWKSADLLLDSKLAKAVPIPLSGAASRADVQTLVLDLEQGTADARLRAATRLLVLGPGVVPAVDALIGALRDPDERVRRLAVETLGVIGPSGRSAFGALKELIGRHELENEALWALNQIQPGIVGPLV